MFEKDLNEKALLFKSLAHPARLRILQYLAKTPLCITGDTGCVSGAVQKEEYLKIIADQGFTDIQIKKEKQIKISDDVLSEFLSAQELKDFKDSGTVIYSITVTANR